jgi:hypothetical protein
MTNDEFQAFLQTAMDELRAKQQKLDAAYGMTACARWDMDDASGKLRLFGSDGGLRVDARVVDIGSFASGSSTWLWAWANESLPARQRQQAAVLKELAGITGFGLFASEAPVALKDEGMAWELAAFSVQHLRALGAYKAPSPERPAAAFFAIMGARNCAA